MQLPGKHTKVTKRIHGDRCVLSTEVEAVRPNGESDGLYLKPEVVRFLDRMHRLADGGDVEELAKHGVIYVRQTA